MNKILLLSAALMPSLEALSLANAITGTKKGIMTRAQATQRAAELEQAMPDGLNDLKPYMLTLYIRSQKPQTKAEQAELRRLVFGFIKEYGFDVDVMTAALEKGLMYSFDEIKQLAQRHVDGIKKYYDQHRYASSHDQLNPVQYTELIKNRFTTSLFQQYNVDNIEELLACVDISVFKNVCQLYGLDLNKQLEGLLEKDDNSAHTIAIIKGLLQSGAKIYGDFTQNYHKIQKLNQLCDMDPEIDTIVAKRIAVYKNRFQQEYDRSLIHKLADFGEQNRDKIIKFSMGSILCAGPTLLFICPFLCKNFTGDFTAIPALGALSAGYISYALLVFPKIRRDNKNLRYQKYSLDALNDNQSSAAPKITYLIDYFKEF